MDLHKKYKRLEIEGGNHDASCCLQTLDDEQTTRGGTASKQSIRIS